MTETAPRIQTPYLLAEDELDRSLRPRRLEDFVGQETLREQLSVAIEACGARGEALDHLLLVGVQAVGPKVALAVLSGGTTRELLNAIATGDSARFQAVPGIGKRTADRIIVELREKVAGAGGVPDEIVVTKTDDPRTLARQGLVGLGFSSQEADELLDKSDGESPEDLIAAALKAAR